MRSATVCAVCLLPMLANVACGSGSGVSAGGNDATGNALGEAGLATSDADERSDTTPSDGNVNPTDVMKTPDVDVTSHDADAGISDSSAHMMGDDAASDGSMAADGSQSLTPCRDGGCAAPNYCFLLACGAGAPPPGAPPCAAPAPVCGPFPSDCNDAGDSFVHDCPSNAGIFYCSGIDHSRRVIQCGFQ